MKMQGGTGGALGDGHVFAEVKKSEVQFKKIRGKEGKDFGYGAYFLLLEVIALQETLYIPLSLASSKKPTGFVYEIEGTAAGTIDSAEVTSRGAGITTVVLGTLMYAKIPQGASANFRILVTIKGRIGKEYKVVLNRVNYKLDPSDARYKKCDINFDTKSLKFRS